MEQIKAVLPPARSGGRTSTAAEPRSALTQRVLLQPPSSSTRPRPTTPRLEKGQQNVFYLAYGSNLNATTFQGRRQIRPLSATNVVVPSLTLTFDLPGIAYLEPCFANVRLADEDGGSDDDEDNDSAPLQRYGSSWEGGVVGVVYEVTHDDWAKILATEGGGAAYEAFTVRAEPLDGGDALMAYTLLAPPSHRYAQPSKRYLELIRKGAEQNGLPQEYRDWLAGLKEYKRTTIRQTVAAVLWAALWVPVFMLLMAADKMFADEEGRAPQWLVCAQRAVETAMWGLYDGFFRWVFGDGERTIGEEGEERDVKYGLSDRK